MHDGDGWDDLILGGRIYRNEQGKRFADYTDRCNLKFHDYPSGIAVADYDRDGRLDIYVSYGIFRYLAAMGLYMLPPTLMAMPIKLIVFVLADGWLLVSSMLLSTFAGGGS